MIKLKQKAWLTLKEAAAYLSNLTQNKDISESALIRHAMEGDLTLAIYLPNCSPSFPMEAIYDGENIPITIEYSAYAGPCCSIENKQPLKQEQLVKLPRRSMSRSLIEAAKLDMYGEHPLSENVNALKELKLVAPEVTGIFSGTQDIDGMITFRDQYVYMAMIEDYKGRTSSTGIQGLWEVPHQRDWAVYLEKLMFELQREPGISITNAIDPNDLTKLTWPPSNKNFIPLKIYANRAEFWARPIFSELPDDALIVVPTSNLDSLIERQQDKGIAETELQEYQPDNHANSADLQRTQRTLAALAIGLAGKHATYRHGQRPNVKALAEVATEHLRDANGRTPHGLSDKTARDAITSALNACPELTKASNEAS
ncbi:hypothetical protein [Marinobacter mobilis]|uniref:hypothetical protein n=1 Tax=Marinobacter mobilis TaxID=488533 RepID=UPI0035C77635